MTHSVSQKLLLWYDKNGRKDLPWRNTDDPYHIYLSEIMLQQTQVKTVLERYYFPFLERFPDLVSLANAELDEVLKMWEGLGYYTRAKNLHKTAKLAQPKLPETYDALLALPGIGKNTASAICAFAYRQDRTVMEANVKRILCRLHAIEAPHEETLRNLADELLDHDKPFEHNQAMMDIGAMVCTIKNPSCQGCPFQSACKAYQLQSFEFPVKKKRQVPTRKRNIVIQYKGNRFKLLQREGRFLHGLWGFEEVEEVPNDAVFLTEVSQQYTHFRLEAKVYLLARDDVEDAYIALEDISSLALSKVDQKILLYLTSHLHL